MKPSRTLIATLTLTLFALAAQAQEKYALQFKATCQSAEGRETLNQTTWARECVGDSTNKIKATLVYHVNGDLNGDVIEVIDSKTGQVLCQKLKLLFATTVANGDESEVTKHVYVFGTQQSENVGSGVVSRKVASNGKAKLSGTLTFYLLPEGDKGLRVCTASFSSSKEVEAP